MPPPPPMRLLACAALAVLPAALAAQPAAPPAVFSEHFLYGYPAGTPAANALVVRDSYALSANAATRFPDWVAFRLTPQEVFGALDLERAWRADPWLDPEATLEPAPDDYRRVSDAGYDRGHLAPLASFRGSEAASEVNYYSNIVPQRSALNQGPWQRLETAVRDLTLRRAVLPPERAPVWVVTGPLYERPMPPLPHADEAHTVPSGFWQVVAVVGDRGSVTAAAFLFEQETPRTSPPLSHLVPVDEVEARSGLDFFRLLPDAAEAALEGAADAALARYLLFPAVE